MTRTSNTKGGTDRHNLNFMANVLFLIGEHVANRCFSGVGKWMIQWSGQTGSLFFMPLKLNPNKSIYCEEFRLDFTDVQIYIFSMINNKNYVIIIKLK